MGCAAGKPLVDDDLPQGRGHDQAKAQSSGDGGGYKIDRHALENSRKSLRALLATRGRDYLVNHAGAKVKVDDLKGCVVGILFGAPGIPPVRDCLRSLSQLHSDLTSSRPFHVVLVCNDDRAEQWQQASLEAYPDWLLALPCGGEHGADETADSLGAKFEVCELPALVLIDREGQVASRKGVEIVAQFGAKAWPFSAEKLSVLNRGTERAENGVNGEEQNQKQQGQYQVGDGGVEEIHGLKGGNVGTHQRPRSSGWKDGQVAPEEGYSGGQVVL